MEDAIEHIKTALSTAPVQAILPAARLRARSGAAIGIGGRAHARHTSGYVQAADQLRMRSAGSRVLLKKASNDIFKTRRYTISPYTPGHWYWRACKVRSVINKRA